MSKAKGADKPVSAGLSSAAGNQFLLSSLNDNNWETFLAVVIPDHAFEESYSKGPQSFDYNAVSKEAANPLFENVTTGSRRKFQTITKSELVQWANENVKSYDACREFKVALDSVSGNVDQVPETFTAKLLKLRLLIFKQEGIDNKFNSKKDSDSQPPGTAQDRKTLESAKVSGDKKTADGKKDDKKDKDAGKNKKDLAPVSSRPTSPNGGKEPEVSKRKSKLRDRAPGKSESRLNCIDDEPDDGPDAYYVLKDFLNPGIFTALMDEQEVPFHAVLRLAGSLPPPDPRSNILDSMESLEEKPDPDADKTLLTWKTTPNTIINAFKNANKAAKSTSPWRNVAFVDVLAKKARDAKELYDALSQKIYGILNERKLYQSFYNKDKLVTIPDLEDLSAKIDSQIYYRHLQSLLPNDSACTPEISLMLALEEVVRGIESEGVESKDESIMTSQEEAGLLNVYFETILNKLADSASADKINDGTASRSNFSRYFKTINHADQAATLSENVAYLRNLSIDLATTVECLPSTYSIAAFQKALQSLSESSKDKFEAFDRERRLETTQLERLTGLSRSKIDRTLFLLELEELVGLKLKPNADDFGGLGDYCWVENLDKNNMLQVLQEAKLSSLSMKMKYSHRQKGLLLAFMGPGNYLNLQSNGSWKHDVKTKVQFGLFHDLLNHNEKYLTSKKEPYAYVSEDEVISYKEEVTAVYPADGASIVIQPDNHKRNVCLRYPEFNLSFANNASTKTSSLNIVYDDLSALSFTSPNNVDSSFAVQASTPEGLLVEFKEEPKVVQRYATPSDKFLVESGSRKDLAVEKGRVILANGTIIKHLRDNQTSICFPDGSSTFINSDGSKIHTAQNGKRQQISQSGEATELPSLNIVLESDPATKKSTTLRDDMSFVHIPAEKKTVCEWLDGTRVTCHKSDGVVSKIKVTCKGYATVEFNGDAFDVSLDNGLILKKSISSTENGVLHNLKVEKENKKLELNTKGECVFYSHRVESEPYHINIKEMSLSAKDAYGNQIEVKEGSKVNVVESDSKESPSGSKIIESVSTGALVPTLLSQSSKSKIQSKPNAPKLFIIREDGSGCQLLRDFDVLPYLRDCDADNETEILEDSLDVEKNAFCVTVVKERSQKEAPIGKSVSPSLVFRQLVRFQPLNEPFRKQFISNLVEYQKWKTDVDSHSDAYGKIFESTTEFIENTSQNEDDALFIFGKDQEETEKQILLKYTSEIRQKLDFVRESKPSFVWDRYTPNSARKVGSAGGFRSQSSIKTSRPISRASHKSARLAMRDNGIPRYFDSDEGKDFLKQASTAESSPVKDTPRRRTVQRADSPPNVEVETESKAAEKPASAKRTASAAATPLKTPDIMANLHIQRKIKPSAVPNTKYLTIEAPARRKLLTASTAVIAKSADDKVVPAIGIFDLSPAQCRFGTLRDGGVYRISIMLTNIGNDSTRFKIKAPTNNLLKVHYKPGPVAPGMKAKVDVEVIAKVENGDSLAIEDKLQVFTEAEIITVPISSTILRGELYDTLAPPLKRTVQFVENSSKSNGLKKPEEPILIS